MFRECSKKCQRVATFIHNSAHSSAFGRVRRRERENGGADWEIETHEIVLRYSNGHRSLDVSASRGRPGRAYSVRVAVMDVIEKKLIEVLNKLKKSPNRVYSLDYIKTHQNFVQANIEQCNKIFNESYLLKKLALKSVLDNCNEVATQISQLLSVKDKKEGTPENPVGVPEELVQENEAIEVEPVFVNMATFADFEGALEPFDGRNKPIAEWIQAFNEVSDACGITPIQKYLYCRRLLKGAARLAVDGAARVGTYQLLTEFLGTTFATEVRSQDVHAELLKARQRADESSEEFAFRMKAMIKGCAVDDPSLVGYIIAGLHGSPSEKCGLYEANTFEGLRRKLSGYDRMQSAIVSSRPRQVVGAKAGPWKPSAAQTSGGQTGGTAALVCRSCNRAGHMAKDCRTALKCEKCNKTGHEARDCLIGKCFMCKEAGHMAAQCPRRSTA